MNLFPTPEEAARVGMRKEWVRIVGVVVRGDRAVVAQVLNADGYPYAYELETSEPWRTDGGWAPGNSGNNNLVWLETGENRGTVVWWDEAPAGAISLHIRVADQEKTVDVEDGFCFAVFDDVPQSSGWRPKLVGWR